MSLSFQLQDYWTVRLLDEILLPNAGTVSSVQKDSKPKVSVGHICLEVSDLATSRRFYESAFKNLGFKTVLDEEDALGLSNEVFAIFLGKPESPRVKRKPPKDNEFVIADHIAILVPDRNTVDETAKLMEKAGFKSFFPPEEHPEFRPGYYSASLCDPDNNVIEFYTVEERK
jgi:catechol 2,3-dioxygenase-like lactoylglutathione lyase family enzyme